MLAGHIRSNKRQSLTCDFDPKGPHQLGVQWGGLVALAPLPTHWPFELRRSDCRAVRPLPTRALSSIVLSVL